MADPVDTSGDGKQHHPWDGGPRVLHGPLTEDEQRIEAERATSLAESTSSDGWPFGVTHDAGEAFQLSLLNGSSF